MDKLASRTTQGSNVEKQASGIWRLSIPAGKEGKYRWAQLDDYLHLPRKDFHWSPPAHVNLSARVSEIEPAGTWGFGFWNDPFNFSFGVGGTSRRLPALPNAAWFFYASDPNHLSLRNDHPAKGMLAATFSSPLIPSLLLSIGIPILPFLAIPWAARYLRKLARIFINEDASQLTVDPTDWHQYRLEWHPEQVLFYIDDKEVFRTNMSPLGKMGFLIWIDNQYAAFPPGGKIQFGTLLHPRQTWLEITDIEMY